MTGDPIVRKRGDKLEVVFASSAERQEHSILLPFNLAGLEVLRHILAEGERERAQGKPSLIGQDSRPVQYAVDQWLREGGRVKKAGSPLDLSEIGLGDDEGQG